MSAQTEKYKHFNHHHEITNEQEMVTIGLEEFIADKKMIPLLKALNEIGLETRTHNYSEDGCFIGIVFDNYTQIEVRKVQELHSTRTRFNGKTELILMWKPIKETSLCELKRKGE